MLGKKFKELRQSKKMSMDETVKGITSKSSLQRWESGKGSMSIKKVESLLERIHVQPSEFLSGKDNLGIYTSKVETMYEKNDIEGLYHLAKKLLDEYELHPSNEKIFFQAAIASNYYMDFTNKNLLSQNNIFKLIIYFSSIEVWTEESVLFFGNIQLLIPTQNVYKFSRSLYSYLIEQKKSGTFYRMAINTLINSIFVLLKKLDFNNANSLLKQMKSLKLSKKYSSDLIRINYAETVFDYLKTGNTNKMNEFLTNLTAIGLVNEAENFKLGFLQFKKIIGNKIK